MILKFTFCFRSFEQCVCICIHGKRRFLSFYYRAVRFLTLGVMEESFPFHYSLLEYLFTLVGLLLFLLDIALDILTVVSFYQDGAYVYMAVMIFLLLGSSVLLQVFSWLWYSDSLDKIETKVEKFADRKSLLKPFHFLQLGVYLRSVTDLLLNFP